MTLGRADLRHVRRDPFLLLLVTGPPALVAILRFGVPFASELPATAGVALRSHHPLLVGFLLCMLVPHLFGSLIGLMLLDERDAGTLLAIRVTPVALRPYLCYRAAVGAVAAGVAIGLGVPLTGLVAPGAAGLAASVVLGAGLATVPLLALPAFANNKVEGLALVKAAGLPWLSPVFAWFLDAPWSWLFGIVPTYWPAAALWAAEAGRAPWPELLAGGTYLTIGSWWLARRVDVRAAGG